MDTSVVSLEEHKKKEFVAPEVDDIRLEWDNVRPGIEYTSWLPSTYVST